MLVRADAGGRKPLPADGNSQEPHVQRTTGEPLFTAQVTFVLNI